MTTKAQQAKIRQMVNFIESEAKEKANEIDIEASEEFTIEKQQLVEEGKKRIRYQYELKEKNVKVEKQKLHSKSIKDARLDLLKLKEQILKETLEKTLKKIKDWVKNNRKEYEKLLFNLTLEGLIVLHESSDVNIYCKEADYSYLSGQLDKLSSEYTKKSKLECKLKIGKKFLSENTSGGVYVCGLHDRIKVNNTLEQRVKLSYDMATPKLRTVLFPDLESLS